MTDKLEVIHMPEDFATRATSAELRAIAQDLGAAMILSDIGRMDHAMTAIRLIQDRVFRLSRVEAILEGK